MREVNIQRYIGLINKRFVIVRITIGLNNVQHFHTLVIVPCVKCILYLFGAISVAETLNYLCDVSRVSAHQALYMARRAFKKEALLHGQCRVLKS